MNRTVIDLPEITDRDQNMTEKERISHSCCCEVSNTVKFSILGILSLIALIFIFITVPLSYVWIEWDEYALMKNSATNKVYYDRVYENGDHFWGLARTPIRFKNTLNTVEFTTSQDDSLDIFTEGGVEIKIDCSFQWKVIKEELGSLFQTYGLTYPSQIESIARSILKNVAPQFTLDQYYNSRDNVSQTLFQALKENLRLQMNVNVTFFQLNFVTFPPIVIERFLNIAVQSQTNIKESYVQQASLIRQQTILLANEYKANATIINSTAINQAEVILKQAEGEAFKIIQDAKTINYQLLFQDLGLNTAELQLSFLYITGLSEAESIKYLIDINTGLINL